MRYFIWKAELVPGILWMIVDRCPNKVNIGILKKAYGYMRNDLARLDGYLTHWDVADMSNIFFFLFFVDKIKRDEALTEILPFEAKWDE